MSELAPDLSTAQILTSVGRYLVDSGADDEDLTLVGSPHISARSRVYQLAGLRGGPRYVLKIPSPGAPSLDSLPPLSAPAQFAALQRACRLYAHEDTHAVARPVALLRDLGGLLVQYIPGDTVSKAVERSVWEPVRAHKAVAAAGDALRRLHRRARRPDVETSLSQLVEDILAAEASALRPSGLQLPDEVRRVVDTVPARTVATRRALLHGDYVGLNLILTRDDEVAMIDPVLVAEGLPQDDVTRFLTVLAAAPVFVAGAVLPSIRMLRRDLERTFLAGYGDLDQPVVLELRLLRQHALRWRRRREHSRLAGHSGLMSARARLIDHHMRGLLRESCNRLAEALGETARSCRELRRA